MSFSPNKTCEKITGSSDLIFRVIGFKTKKSLSKFNFMFYNKNGQYLYKVNNLLL